MTSFELSLTTPGYNASLSQNRPNPFNPSTVIDFEMDQTDLAVLEIYDISGHKVIASKNKETGVSNLKSGTYIILLKDPNNKILIIKQFVKK